MSCPVRPPAFDAILLALAPILLIELPALLDTLLRPSEAFDVTLEAPSLAFVAVEDAALAACDVVEALRSPTRLKANRHVCRRTAREGTKDMLKNGRRRVPRGVQLNSG